MTQHEKREKVKPEKLIKEGKIVVPQTDKSKKITTIQIHRKIG